MHGQEAHATFLHYMPHLPRRHSLIDETAAVLRRRLDAGEWAAHLPGEHELASLLQIGRNTLRAALRLLESEGRLRNRNGLRREVVPRRGATPGKHRAVLVMAKPENEFPPSTSAWIGELRSRLEALDWAFHPLVEPAAYRGKPERLLRSLASGSPNTVWILHRSTSAMQRWFEDRKLAAVLAGSRHEGIFLPQVEVDLPAVSRHAAGRFLARGHQRLAVLLHEGLFAGDTACLAAFREAATRAEVVELRSKGGPPGVIAALHKHLRGPQRATGLYVLHPDHCVTALSYLLGEGVRIPDDLSLICRDDEPYLGLLHPEPSRYRHSPRGFAAKLASLVTRPELREGESTRRALLMPRAVAGTTLAPPPVSKENG